MSLPNNRSSDARSFVFQVALPMLEASFGAPGAAANLIRRSYAHNVLEYAAMLAMRGRPNDQPLFRQLLADYASAFTQNPQALASDFFSALPLASAIRHGLANSWIATSDSFLDPVMIDAVCKPDWSLRGAQNQAMIKAAGTAYCLSSIPSLLLNESVGSTYSAYIEAVWNDFSIRAQGDTTENAPQYNVIFLSGLWVLVHANQTRRNWLRNSANAFHMFTDFAEQVSPLGVLPSYGDDGLGTPLVFAGDWASVLAFAGRLYDNHVTGNGNLLEVSQLQAAALRVWQFNTAGPLTTTAGDAVGVFLHPVRSTQPLFHMALLDSPTANELQLGAAVADPYGSEALATVTTRVPETPDKVVLVSNDNQQASKSAALFACADVFSSPFAYHAHAQQVGALAMLSMGDAVLLYGLGYNNRLANQSNTMVLSRSKPLSMAAVMQGVWQTAVLPTSNLEPFTVGLSGTALAIGLLSTSEMGSDLRNFNRTVTFRVQYRGAGTGNLTIRNLRLQAQTESGQTYPLPAAEGASGANTDGSQVTYSSCGGDAVAFHTYPLRNGSVTFSIKDYPYVAFDWKFEAQTDRPCEAGKPPPAAAGSTNAPSYTLLIFRASPSALFDLNVLTDPMPRPQVVAAQPIPAADAPDSGLWQAAASYRLEGFGSQDTTWTRELFLSTAANETLLVRDTVIVGNDLAQSGYGSLGPVWNFLGRAFEFVNASGIIRIRGFPNAATMVAHDDQLVAEVRLRCHPNSSIQVSNSQVMWANAQPVVVTAQVPVPAESQTIRFETTIRLLSERSGRLES
jgi:hypothetical protein